MMLVPIQYKNPSDLIITYWLYFLYLRFSSEEEDSESEDEPTQQESEDTKDCSQHPTGGRGLPDSQAANKQPEGEDREGPT